MSEKTVIAISLSIFGDRFDLDELTNKISLRPSQSWNKGEIIPFVAKKDVLRISPLFRKETCWEYSTGYVETLFLEEVSALFIERVGDHVPAIKESVDRNALVVKIDVVVKAFIDAIPSLVFSPELIGIANELNTGIGVDLYVSG